MSMICYDYSEESMKGALKMARPSSQELVQQRLSALELAEALGNVSEACRRRGISETQFYEYRRRFLARGLEGLKDLPPVHHSHPQKTPPKTVEEILSLSLAHPMWGCVTLSERLKLTGISVSSRTIQNILIKNDLASQYQRLLRIEEQALEKEIELTAEQARAIEKINPCFKESHAESSRPGELLCQGTCYVGNLEGVGKVYLQSVVDTWGSYGFVYLHTGKLPEHAVTVLHNDVLPQYVSWRIPVSAILTDNGREYCGRELHAYESYLASNGIEHKTKRQQTNGFIERFNVTIMNEFFRPALRQKFYASIEILQKDLDFWLLHYNHERPHRGYRNQGKRPVDTVKLYLED